MPKLTALRLASVVTGHKEEKIYQKVDYEIADFDCDSEGCWRCSDYPEDLPFHELIEYYGARKGFRVKAALLLSRILGI